MTLPSSCLVVRPHAAAPILPQIIQGGMGVAVSRWRLARAVSLCGQLGVVSGTGLDTVMVRRLQDGDADGAMRRALAAFPIPGLADRVIARYWRRAGRGPGEEYQLLPMYRQVASAEREAVTMLAAFAETWLAKEGHRGLVGINMLTKVQRPNLATLYGAMLAGVDYVLMGAGIPREIPAALDALCEHRVATLRMDVVGAKPDDIRQIMFDPSAQWPQAARPPLRRPKFLPIVASNSLAAMLAHKLGAGIDGFVIEGPTAGGHNAPPRGKPVFNPRGEPVYGARDEVDLAEIRQLGFPFWLAGGTGKPSHLQAALADGAAGIQVGTLFAFCDESGITPALRESVLCAAARGEVDVVTDPAASPTGYPFKIVEWPANPAPVERERICDLGYLRVAYARDDGRIGYRCASEPVKDYVAKGGDIADTIGRRCLCNGLMANVGIGQVRDDGRVESPLLTSGDDITSIATFLRGRTQYSAADVIDYLLGAQQACHDDAVFSIEGLSDDVDPIKSS